MKMTFDQYINNPMGVKNAVFSGREMYRSLYIEKLDKILVREVGKVKYRLYKNKDKYYVYMKIPSEVIPNFYYDTVIEFFTDKIGVKSSNSLKEYYIKFYSNDPSFVYTFAHAMLKNDLFIKELVPRMSKEAVKKVAKEKNPKMEIGYVKSIYFTYLLMKNYGLFNKIVFNNESEKFDLKEILSLIEHADIKIEKRQQAQRDISKEKKINKKKEKNIDNSNKNMSYNSNISNKIGKTKNVKKIGKINNIKRI